MINKYASICGKESLLFCQMCPSVVLNTDKSHALLAVANNHLGSSDDEKDLVDNDDEYY